MSKPSQQIAILEAGNIGTIIACGLAQAGNFNTINITLTRRKGSKAVSG